MVTRTAPEKVPGCGLNGFVGSIVAAMRRSRGRHIHGRSLSRVQGLLIGLLRGLHGLLISLLCRLHGLLVGVLCCLKGSLLTWIRLRGRCWEDQNKPKGSGQCGNHPPDFKPQI